jgi:hypothetical protein
MLVQAWVDKTAPSGLGWVSFAMNNLRTDEGAASMVLGTIPVSTVNSHAPKKSRMLATGRILRIRGVLTLTAS